jgi:hypothetical protein
MRQAKQMAFMFFALGVVAGVPPASASGQGVLAAPPAQWEYRVLTREQLAELGKNDPAAGLNALGEEGWELVAVEPAVAARPAQFYLKRPKGLQQTLRESLRRQVAWAESEVQTCRDRVAWSERMVKKGYLSDQHLQGERLGLRRAEAVLEEVQRELDRLPPPPQPVPPKERKPEEE